MYFFEHFDIVTISTDKNTFLIAILKKLTLDNIFIKVKKKSARAAYLKWMELSRQVLFDHFGPVYLLQVSK